MERAVARGRGHQDLSGVEAIGVDEIAWQPDEQQNDYYDMNIALRSNRKQGASNNESLTDRTKED